jgi:hypothetical protein
MFKMYVCIKHDLKILQKEYPDVGWKYTLVPDPVKYVDLNSDIVIKRWVPQLERDVTDRTLTCN